MKAVTTLVFFGAVLASPALADQSAHFEIVDEQFFGDCGPEGSAIVDQLSGSPVLELNFADLNVLADDNTSYAHRNCWAKVTLQPEPGYKLKLKNVFYQGSATIDPEAPANGGRVSVRGYFPGQTGLNGYRSFAPGFTDNYTVRAEDGHAPSTACGQTTQLNLFVSAAAYQRAGNGAISEISVDRGSGTAAGRGHPVDCGIQADPCDD